MRYCELPSNRGEHVALPELYKINLKTGTSDRASLLDYCLKESVLGVGWGPHWAPKLFSSDAANDFDIYRAGAEKFWSRRAIGPAIALHDAAEGSLVWFRDLSSVYYLARIVGPWRLLEGVRFEEMDLANVRSVEYFEVPEGSVPGGVIRGFASPRQLAFNRVRDEGARLYSALLASERWNTNPPEVGITTEGILDLLSPLDMEDLVAAYLQDTKDYLAFPARHSRSTAVYEFILSSRRDGTTAAVQVKTGNATVAEAGLSEKIADRWFVYSASGQAFSSRIETISKAELVDYIESRPAALPPVVEAWRQRVSDD